MSAADAVAAVLFAAVTLYAVFGGADFGSGVWDLVAGNTERGGALRRLVDHSIGPVWEANHVWLIFVLVFLWTGFPEAFASLMQAVALPFWLAGLGIVLRGAGFAFRKFAPTVRWARAWGSVFALSSLLTPFFLGTVAGAVASGRVPASIERGQPGPGVWSSWTGPTSLLGGVLAVLVCTFLSGVFLARDAQRLHLDDLADELRRRSFVVGLATGAVALGGVIPLAIDAETLFEGLTGAGLWFIVLSAGAGLTALYLLRRRQLGSARVAAVVAVAAIVLGWGVGQYPWLLVDEVTIDDAAASSPTLVGLLVASGVAAVLVVPPLVWLLILADRDLVGVEASPQRTSSS